MTWKRLHNLKVCQI